MQLRCTYCQTMFAISREETLAALEHMDENNLKYYDAHCPSCRRANRVERFRLEFSFPGWRAALKEMAQQPAAGATAPLPQAKPVPPAAPVKMARPAPKLHHKAAAKKTPATSSPKGKKATVKRSAAKKAPAKPAATSSPKGKKAPAKATATGKGKTPARIVTSSPKGKKPSAQGKKPAGTRKK
jgi:hypothetical protein